MTKRNYQHENAAYKSKPAQIEKRVGRNEARAIMEKKVGKAALKGKEINHRDGDPTNNSLKNLQIMSPTRNNTGRRGGSPTKGK